MATKVLSGMMTIAEAAKRVHSGQLLTIAELLEETNEFAQDAPVEQANDQFSHVLTSRVKLPTTAPRRFNKGAQRAISSVEQSREYMELLEMFIEMDQDEVDFQPDPQKFRSDEVVAHVEAHNQRFVQDLLYGNHQAKPEEINGFLTRFNDLSLDNVHDMGGQATDSQSSILFVEWGPRKTFLIYPRGASGVGLSEKDLGPVRVTDDAGNPYMAYSYQIKATYGLAVHDPKAVQRIANVESDFESADNGFVGADKTGHRLLVKAKNQLPGFGRNAVMYTNRAVKTQFDIWAMEKANGFYTVDNITGQPLTMFQGVPVKMVDRMLATEDVVA